MTNMSTQERRLERIKSNLKGNKYLTDNNREDILKFFKHMEALGRSQRTMIKSWDRLKILVEEIPNKDFRKFTKEDFESILADIRKKYSDWSIATAQKVYRAFWRWLYGLEKDERAPDAVRWFEISEPPTKLTKNDLLTKEEKDAIIATTNNLMQKSLIAVLNAGTRPGEVLGMTLGDVSDEKEFIKIYAKDGKMKKKLGQRPIYVLEYADCLRAWINSHPQKGDKKAPLFVTDRGPLQYRNLNVITKRLGEKAGLKKRVWPYVFRHGYGTLVYSKYGASHGKRLMGHKTLKQESVYVHLDESDLEARLLGKEIPENGETVKEEEIEMEQKRELFMLALDRREDIKKEIAEEMIQTMEGMVQKEVRKAFEALR